MTLSGTEAQFRITYDGAALSIYPTDAAAQAVLENSESRHNVDVVSNALHIAFSQMGLQLDDLDVVYVYY